MKALKPTLVRAVSLTAALLYAGSAQAGLLDTQHNPVSNSFDPYTIANWSSLPQYAAESPGDATAEGYDWLFTQVAHNDGFVFIRYHQSHSFSGDRQLMYFDTDLNRNTGLPGWSGNLAIGAERYLDGAALRDSTGSFIDWAGWNQTQDGSGNWDIMIALSRSTHLSGVTAFDFVNQNHGFATDDWYPNAGNSGPGGDYFRYTTVPEPGALALLGLGGLFLAMRRRSR